MDLSQPVHCFPRLTTLQNDLENLKNTESQPHPRPAESNSGVRVLDFLLFGSPLGHAHSATGEWEAGVSPTPFVSGTKSGQVHPEAKGFAPSHIKKTVPPQLLVLNVLSLTPKQQAGERGNVNPRNAVKVQARRGHSGEKSGFLLPPRGQTRSGRHRALCVTFFCSRVRRAV